MFSNLNTAQSLWKKMNNDTSANLSNGNFIYMLFDHHHMKIFSSYFSQCISSIINISTTQQDFFHWPSIAYICSHWTRLADFVLPTTECPVSFFPFFLSIRSLFYFRLLFMLLTLHLNLFFSFLSWPALDLLK